MTQPDKAVGGESDAPELTPEDRLNAVFGDDSEEQEEEEEEEEEDNLEESDSSEKEGEEEDGDLPPIDPPVSLSAEDKEAFKKWPRAAQEVFSKRINEVERGFHAKAREAASARQDVEQAAHQQLSGIERGYAERFQQLAAQIAPQRPNPALLQHDPQAFYSLQAKFEADVAQQQQLQQQAYDYAEQAKQREALIESQELARERQLIAESFPELNDPTTGPKLQQELTAVARELGYSEELINHARAADVLAMRKAAEWKAKAEKLDQLNASKMAKARAAKGMPKMAVPGSTKAPGASRHKQYASDREAMRRGDNDATLRVLDAFFRKT